MNQKKLNIIIVDDSTTFREGVKFYLENILSHKVIFTAGTGKEFLEFDKLYLTDIILMDIEMPVLDGIKATLQALWMNKDLKILAVTNYQDKAYLTELVSSGFRGCVFKNNIYKQLEEAITQIMSGGYYYPGNIKL